MSGAASLVGTDEHDIVTGWTFDAGALIALDTGDRTMTQRVEWAKDAAVSIAVPAGALARVWRDGARQARLARLLRLKHVKVIALDDRAARAAGRLCGATGTSDVVDASVVLCARERGHAIVTSDAGDLARLDPRAVLVAV